jgi:hypothetical protein
VKWINDYVRERKTLHFTDYEIENRRGNQIRHFFQRLTIKMKIRAIYFLVDENLTLSPRPKNQRKNLEI